MPSSAAGKGAGGVKHETRMVRVQRMLFDCRQPITSEELAIRTYVRREGVRPCLRLLERIGQAERCGITRDRRLLWRWRESQSEAPRQEPAGQAVRA